MFINPNKSLTEHWPVVERIYYIKPEDLHQKKKRIRGTKTNRPSKQNNHEPGVMWQDLTHQLGQAGDASNKAN